MRMPYALTAAVDLEKRYAQMRLAIARPLPRLQERAIDDRRTLHIACYGPSLADTYRELGRPLMSMSGATKWLHARGITPDYHIDMDPRGNKVMTSLPPVPGVQYLVASICVPEYFDALAGQDVVLWHAVSSTYDRDTAWLADADPDEVIVHTGQTIGLGAIQLGGVLGYRHFEIDGMDGSFRDGARHAGPHAGKTQKADITWDAGRVTYRTSKIMANAVAETINTIRHTPIFCVFHGTGLTQALVRETNVPNACCADETDKVARVRSATARFLDVPQVPLQQAGTSIWDLILAQPQRHQALADVLAIAREAERRRPAARYNTGTVPVETALLLRMLTIWYRPRVVVEIGTFIGTSTVAMAVAQRVYTCDRDNDCLPSTECVTCFPGQTSTQMLQHLIDRNVSVDLFFFDGRLQPGDVELVRRLSHGRTVYAFDDFVGKEKGVINLAKLKTVLPQHVIVEPYTPFAGRSTLAALLPVAA